uniref:Lipoprotein n=1 Tax=Dictyoglomus turgidum TaxID=513050 RepID=A0A7C3WQA2_9BACT
MKKFITLFLIVTLILSLSFAQNTQTPTQKNTEKKPVTIFTLHVLTFNSLVKSNLEKDLKGLDDSFKMSIPIYHPAIGLNLSFYTKLSQKGNPYPSMINRILKNLVSALNTSELPDKTNINIILYTEDEKNIYDSKTLFITFTLSSLKEFAKTKDINKFGGQMLVFLETEKLEYKNGVFSSKNYDFEWILKI